MPDSISRRGLLYGAALGAAAYSFGTAQPAEAATTTGIWNFPRGLRASSQYALNAPDMNLAEHLLASTFQGQLSARPVRTGPVIHIWSDSTAYGTWLRDFEANYGVPTKHTNIWELVDILVKPGTHGPGIGRYILCKMGTPSVNVANSLAGLTGAVVVDESIEQKAITHGLRRILDVRGKGDRWLREHHWNNFRHDLVIEQGYVDKLSPLRDYAILAKSYTFFDGVTDFRRTVLEGLESDAVVLGWGPGDVGEDVFVSQASKAGVRTVPADWNLNLSVYSGISIDSLRQKARPPVPTPQPGKHYVSFLYSDGDNLQMTVGSLQTTEGWWANPHRGEFDLGWGMPPSIIDLAPTAAKWLYNTESSGLHYDRFVAGPSGGGYLYPSLYPRDELRRHTGRLARAMAALDLDVAQIIDFNSFENKALWSEYLRHEQIRGLIYLEYSRYDHHDGRVLWVNEKPIISVRQNFWGQQSGSEEPDVIAKLNSQVADPTSARGYSVVLVHNWSKGVGNIKTVVDALGPHIEIVTPDTLVEMVTRNVTR